MIRSRDMIRSWLYCAAILLCGAFLCCTSANAQTSGVPTGNIVAGNASGTTAAVAGALPAISGKTTYICGFSVSAGSATAAITLSIQVAGLIGGTTFNYSVGAPVTAAGTTAPIITQAFYPCVPGNAPNTSITVTSGALGAGGVSNNVNLWGFVQ